jgi:hypothetical protein
LLALALNAKKKMEGKEICMVGLIDVVVGAGCFLLVCT